MAGAGSLVVSAWAVSVVVGVVLVAVVSSVGAVSATLVSVVGWEVTGVVASPLLHAAIARAVATEAVHKPGDGRTRDRLGVWPGTCGPTTRPGLAVAGSASPPCRAMSKLLTLQRTERTPLVPHLLAVTG